MLTFAGQILGYETARFIVTLFLAESERGDQSLDRRLLSLLSKGEAAPMESHRREPVGPAGAERCLPEQRCGPISPKLPASR